MLLAFQPMAPWWSAGLPTPQGIRAFRWTAAGGMQDLGTLGGSQSYAYGVSADGAVVVGWADNAAGQSRAFRWTASGGMQDLGTLGGGSSGAYGVSADGAVVVGWATNGAGYHHAFRWTASGGMQDLGVLPYGDTSHARGVSADGAVVVGVAQTVGYYHAFRWTASGGMQDLGTLPGGRSSVAYGVSADGAVVVGEATNASGYWHAFRWTASGGMQDLGTLGGDRSWAYGVSADGAVVVGWATNASRDGHAFRWTASGGMEDLNITYANLLINGSVLREARAISPDGRYIVGTGYNAATGRNEAFLLDTGVSSNRPPAVPTLIAPAHNARVSSLPTFQLRASDPDGDRVRFEVQVWQGSDVRTFSVPASGYVASDQVASGTPPQPLPAGTWRWKARTWDERGGVSSWSGERTFQVPPSELNPPTNLQAQAISSTQIRLTWQDNSPDETGFEIQRRHQNATSFATIATVRAGQTSYTDWALAPATTYVYRVRAVDTVQGRVSAWSNEASATTLGDLPAAPSDLRAQALSGSQVLLTWRDNSNNEQGFEIQRAQGSTGAYQTLTRVSANVFSYIDRQGLQPDTEYRYRVRAYNAAGTSDWSNEASVRTLSNIDFSSYSFIKANLHSHTNYSDGVGSIEEAWLYLFHPSNCSPSQTMQSS
jgi:probable HAF family extracellular repeat protein